MPSVVLLIHCPDKKGLITEVTQFLWSHHANILDLDEHVEREAGHFFMRVHFDPEGFDIPEDKIDDEFGSAVGVPNRMKWQFYFLKKTPKMALFVSRSSHCLYDILARHKAGELKVDIPLIVSNHTDLEDVARRFDIPFYYFEVSPSHKKEVEARQLQLMRSHAVDFIVLARYMQILGSGFIAAYPDKIINIHHSFLPAFPGARPYHQAHKRGVKLIGATSHYVTEVLDEGPIIEQDVVKISHKDRVRDLVRKGKDLEKIVLSRAIEHHVLRKVLVSGNKTIVFD